MDRLNRLLGRSVPWLVLAMVAVTFTIVLFRYVFGRSWVWMQETVVYLHAFLFLLAAGYALWRDVQVRVDLFYRPMTPRRRAGVNLAGALILLLPTCIVIGVQSWPYVIDSWQVLEGSKDPGGLDAVFILKSGLILFCLLLGLQALATARRSLATLLQGSG